MKLADWAKKQGISYLTAYRWFQSNRLPVPSYQSPSGTIIVEDESENLEQPMAGNNQASTDVMSLFLKKTVEFSKNNSSIEDFAAYILSTFSLKINYGPDSPKYSKNKPKSEDIQKHFQQFIKPKGEKPKANMFVAEPEALDELVEKSDSLTAQELVSEIQKCGSEITPTSLSTPELNDLFKDINSSVYTMDNMSTAINAANAEGLVSRTVDFNSTPQQINYTSSTDQPLGNFSLTNGGMNAASIFPEGTVTFTTDNANNAMFLGGVNTATVNSLFAQGGNTFGELTNYGRPVISYNGIALQGATGDFKPTQKELISATKVLEVAPEATPRKRGRKPSKNLKK